MRPSDSPHARRPSRIRQLRRGFHELGGVEPVDASCKRCMPVGKRTRSSRVVLRHRTIDDGDGVTHERVTGDRQQRPSKRAGRVEIARAAAPSLASSPRPTRRAPSDPFARVRRMAGDDRLESL